MMIGKLFWKEVWLTLVEGVHVLVFEWSFLHLNTLQFITKVAPAASIVIILTILAQLLNNVAAEELNISTLCSFSSRNVR